MPGQTQASASETAEVVPTATASSTPENIPDLSRETIILAAFCDQSSLLASDNSGRIRALQDAVAAINESGGIFGAELDLRLIDTQGNSDESQRALARTVRQIGEGPLVLICDPQTEAALGEMLNEDEIPALGPGDFAIRGEFIFGVDANPQEHLGYFLDDLAAHWAKRKPEGAGDEIRLALIAWPAEVGGPLTSEEFLSDLEDLNIQIVHQVELPAELNANIFDLIYQLRDANANVIFTNMRGFGLAALLNALDALGLRDRFVVGTPASGYNRQLFEYLANPTNSQGLYLTSAWAWWSEEEHPGIQSARRIGAGEEMSDWGYIQMAGAVALAQRVLENAILDVGFEALSPEAVARALNALVDYPVMSGLFTVDYSGGTRSLDQLHIWAAGVTPGELELVE